MFENNILHLEINDHVIYNRLGGTELSIYPFWEHTIYGGGEVYASCDTNGGHTHWKAAPFDILAHGFLKEGENHMKIKLAVHWFGHVGVKIDARKKCCSRLIDKWEKRCWIE